jgi:hypothetical protein
VLGGVLKSLIPRVTAWKSSTPALGEEQAASDSTKPAAAAASEEVDEVDADDKELDTMSGVSDDEDNDPLDREPESAPASASKQQQKKKEAAGGGGEDDPRLWDGEEEDSKAQKKPAAAAVVAEEDDDEEEEEEEPQPSVSKLPYELLSGAELAAAEAQAAADPIMHLFMIYTNSNPQRHQQFLVSLQSIFDTTPISAEQPVAMHFCADHTSAPLITQAITPHLQRLNTPAFKSLGFHIYDIKEIEGKLSSVKPLIAKMEQHFTSGGTCFPLTSMFCFLLGGILLDLLVWWVVWFAVCVCECRSCGRHHFLFGSSAACAAAALSAPCAAARCRHQSQDQPSSAVESFRK